MMDDAILNAADDGVNEVAGMTNAEKAVQPRRILAIDSDQRGTLARLECGHDIRFVVSPDMFRRLYTAGVLYCAECVTAYLDSIRPAPK